MIEKLKYACLAFITIMNGKPHIFVNQDLHSIDGTMEDVFCMIDYVNDIPEDDLNEQSLINDVNNILNEK